MGVVASVVDTGRYNPGLRNEWRVEAGRRRERRGGVERRGKEKRGRRYAGTATVQ